MQEYFISYQSNIYKISIVVGVSLWLLLGNQEEILIVMTYEFIHVFILCCSLNFLMKNKNLQKCVPLLSKNKTTFMYLT